jgi:aminotransferase
VPGTAFGPGGKGHFRACFATGYKDLITACDRMERFISQKKS